jgi:hypothetical protein
MADSEDEAMELFLDDDANWEYIAVVMRQIEPELDPASESAL